MRWDDKAAVNSVLTAAFSVEDMYVMNWKYPVGAFHGSEGGPC